jgi:hypothetical protein
MGYSIPPGDYSLPPMQVNVAADLGKSLAAQITAIGNIRRQQRAEAKRLQATQNAFKNNLILQQNELKTGYFGSLEKAGITNDPDKENELFDQFQQEVDTRARAALDARMKMQFDADLDDDERIKLGKIVNDFKSYSEKSLAQMGGLIADATIVKDKDNVVVGDPMNGEQLGNVLALQNINGAAAASFDPNAITSRQLTTRGNQNIVTSTVKIPANSAYFKDANKAGEGGANSIIQNGLLAGTIKEEEIDGKKFLVFKTDINVSNYSSKGGMDLVQKKLPIQSSDQILQENKYLSKQGSWNQAFVIQNPVVIAEVEKDSNGKPTGYSNKVDYNIVNVGAMTLDKAYIAELDSEYESVFNNPNVSQAQKQQYLIDIGIVENIKSIQNRTPEEQKKLIMDAMGENIWEGYFPEKYVSSGTGSQQIQKQLGTYNEKTKQFDLDEADKALLKSIQDQGIKNPLTGELYQEGESIYVIRTEKSRVTPKPSSDDAVDQYSYFYNMSDEELINSLTDAPLTVTGRGTYLVDPDGNIVRNDGSANITNYPVIVKKDQNPKKFRDILRSASAQQRNK